MYWEHHQPWIDEIGETAQKLAGNSIKKSQDNLIGEIAKLNNHVLVSADIDFISKAKNLGIKIMTSDEFITIMTRQTTGHNSKQAKSGAGRLKYSGGH